MKEATTRQAVGSGSMIRIGRLGVIFVLVLTWQGLAAWLGEYTMATPRATLAALRELVGSGAIWSHLAATARVSGIGLVAGWIAGVAASLMLSASARLADAVEPYVMASMGIPKFALAPLLILWFGIGDAPKAVVVTLMVFYAVFVTAMAGSRAVDRRLIAMARLVGASPSAAMAHVLLPSMTPYLLAGLKVAVPRAISAAVVGEFIVADSGLGYYIEHSRQTGDIAGVYAGLVVVAVLVVCSHGILGWLERRLLAWRPAPDATNH